MYKALYRKYRPKKFEDLVGQEHITNVLQNQIATDSFTHAYLFSGTRGTGKTSCAKIFARAINCLEDNNKPCNKCENCLESLDESSIDIIEIDAASNNGVDNIRDLKDRAFYQPTSLKYKVYIIDEVHMLSKGAFNALLKILEEPPRHLIFILATTELERIPMTILSRCQKFQFKRIDFQSMEKSLKDIAQKENVKIDDETIKLITNNADGAMRDAQSILEQLISSGHSEIDYTMATGILGIVNTGIVENIIDNIINNLPGDLLESIDDGLSSGKDVEQLGKDILNHFRSIMIAKVSKDSIDRFINTNKESYINQSEKISLDNILGAMERLINQLSEIKYSQQKRALLEIALLDILEMCNSSGRVRINARENKEAVVSENIQERKNIKENKTVEKSENTTKDKVNNIQEENVSENNETKKLSSSNSDLDLARIKEDWNDILTKIKNSEKKLLQALIIEASIVDYKNNVITLGFYKDYKFHKDKLMSPDNREFVEKVISMFYNMDVKINAEFIGEDDDSIDKDIESLTNLIGKNNIKIF